MNNVLMSVSGRTFHVPYQTIPQLTHWSYPGSTCIFFIFMKECLQSAIEMKVQSEQKTVTMGISVFPLKVISAHYVPAKPPPVLR